MPKIISWTSLTTLSRSSPRYRSSGLMPKHPERWSSDSFPRSFGSIATVASYTVSKSLPSGSMRHTAIWATASAGAPFGPVVETSTT